MTDLGSLLVASLGEPPFDSPLAAFAADRHTNEHYVDEDDRVIFHDTVSQLSDPKVSDPPCPAEPLTDGADIVNLAGGDRRDQLIGLVAREREPAPVHPEEGKCRGQREALVAVHQVVVPDAEVLAKAMGRS